MQEEPAPRPWARPWARFGRGWGPLIATWTVLGLGALGTVGWLAWAGPPEPGMPAVAAVEEAATPSPAAGAPAGAEAPQDQAAPAAPAERAAVASLAMPMPAAPEPPPLAEPAERSPEQPGRPIPPPDPALLEPGPYGPLPRIGAEGRNPIRAYARPFDRQDQRPRIGLVIGGLGMNAALTEEAIRRLPAGVTLAFSPYAPQVERLLAQARARGMEFLVALPLEPTGHPLNNAGDRALLTSLPMEENEDRLEWVLSRFAGYVGAIGALGPMRGERFALLGDRLGAVQQALHGRGLLYVDPRPTIRGPDRAWGRVIDLVVDEPATRGEIDRRLEALEALARERHSALGYAGEPSPVLVERVAAWGAGVEGRGLVLAPVSALIRPPQAQAGTLPARARAE